MMATFNPEFDTWWQKDGLPELVEHGRRWGGSRADFDEPQVKYIAYLSWLAGQIHNINAVIPK